MELWVLVGEGPNNVSIPAMVWADREAALASCKELLGDQFKTMENDGKTSFRWDDLSKESLKKLYTSYYGGCGECDFVVLKSVEEGTPFVCWDLD